MTRRRLGLLAAALMLTGCAKSPQGSSQAHAYKLTGTITRLDPANKVATIRHDRILDDQGKVWMEAMTMDFPVRSEQAFAMLQVGAKISATVYQNEANFEFWISNIQLIK